MEVLKIHLIATVIIGVVVFSSCSRNIQLASRRDSINVCFRGNEHLSFNENKVFDSSLNLAAEKVRSFQVIVSCDTANSNPMLSFRPVSYNYAANGERIIKSVISAASIFSAIYFNFWLIVVPLPDATVEYEVSSSAPTTAEQIKFLKTSKLSFYGDSSRQLDQLSANLRSDISKCIDDYVPKKIGDR